MKTIQEWQEIILSCGSNAVTFLEKAGFLYIRPEIGLKKLGPIVGRGSTYTVEGQPGIRYRYVSENYYNGTELLTCPQVVINHLANLLVGQMKTSYAAKGVEFRGVGKIGIRLAQTISVIREQDPSNHPADNGEENRIALVQDILEPVSLIENIRVVLAEKKKVAFVCCIINPEQAFDSFLPLTPHTHNGPLQLVTLIKQMLTKYQQDYPLVEEDIKNNNIVWEPKENWHILAKVMEEANTADHSRDVKPQSSAKQAISQEALKEHVVI